MRDLLDHAHKSLDPRHVAWSLSSLYNLACYLDWAGLAHNAIALDTYFVSPEQHSGALLGGWWYARPRGEKPLRAPGRTVTYAEAGIAPIVHVDPDAAVTTPCDMVITQVAEIARNAGRHGSCGIGFGETIERNLTPRYALSVADLGCTDHLMRKLDDIRRTWAPARLAQLGIHKGQGESQRPCAPWVPRKD